MTRPPDGIAISPYPKGRDNSMANAPVVQNYTDAEDILDKVQKTRQTLESNLTTILRTKQEGEIYNLISELTRDR